MTGSGWRRRLGRRQGGEAPTERRSLPPSLIAGGTVLGLVTVFAIAAPIFGNPLHQNLTGGLSASGVPLGPGAPHYLLGTDTLGRNMLTRLA